MMTPVRFHSTALVLWLVAALLPIVLTRHPLYLLMALGIHVLLQARLPRAPEASAWRTFAGFSLLFVLVASAFQVILGSVGETVLLELPSWRVTGDDGSLLFRIGGPITLENVLFSVTTAMAVFAVILALATWNALVDHYLLLRSLPAFLHQTATVVSIAVTFMPQLILAQREIREAQALRGHHIRGLRDLLPLVMTLLTEGLERAISLAESMEARGWSATARSSDTGGRRQARWWLALGLGAVLAGAVVRGLEWAPRTGLVLVAAGGVALALTLWRIGRRTRRGRYRHEPWQKRDSVLAGASLISGGGLLALRFTDKAPFVYELLPRAGWPSFDWRIAALMLFVLTPLLVAAEKPRGNGL